MSDLHSPDLRQARLARRLSGGAPLGVAALAAELGVSSDTVRRDLARLEAAGLARRVRGGALPATPAAPLRDRRSDLDAALLARAAELLAGAPTLLLDGGTSVAALARHLAARPGRIVLTPSPEVAAIVHGLGIATITIGGPLSEPGGIATGSAAEAALAEHCPDIAVLGACGLDAEAGLTSDDLPESRMKRAMADAAAATMVIASAAKLGRRARHRTLPAEAIGRLVTDAGPGATAPLAALGLAVTGPA